jgi:hypothetical protein
MNYVTYEEPSDSAYLIPIGDLHVGDRAFGGRGLKKLKGYLEWVQAHPNSRIFLMGDIFNLATRTSKTSPFESDPNEMERLVDIFAPVKDRIIGACRGNHENRSLDFMGFDVLKAFCTQLDIPYCGLSTIIRVRVGQRPAPDDGTFWQTYYVYAHHTTGGGATLGGALNRVVKLQDLVQGVDVYLGGHNHQLVTGPRVVLYPGKTKIEHRELHFVDCGSYLDWQNSYAEAKMLPLGKLGSPRVRFSGVRDKHDVHVSI